MGTYKRGRIWWISYADPSGTTRRESTGQTDARVAERLYRQRKRDVAAGTWVDPRTTGGAAHPTVADYAERWVERQRDRGLRNARCEEQKLRGHVLPLIGSRRLEDLRPRDVIRFVDELRRRPREDGRGPLAPRTVRQCYDVLRRLCRDAVIDEVIASTPCVLPPGTLPAKRDRDPSWRATAIFTRAEVEQLISDERVPWDRRVLYALELLLGVRHGEAAGRRWRDYDSTAEPLGRMWVATQYDDQRLKSGTPREVPVHSTLAAILAEWRLGGFALFLGRPPRPDDYIVPETDQVQHGRIGQHRLQGSSLRRLHRDLETLGMRLRRQHDARRTLISLGRTDGASLDILRACTHGSSREVIDDYTTWTWDAKCREIGRIRVQRRVPAEVHNLVHSEADEASEAQKNRA